MTQWPILCLMAEVKSYYQVWIHGCRKDSFPKVASGWPARLLMIWVKRQRHFCLLNPLDFCQFTFQNMETITPIICVFSCFPHFPLIINPGASHYFMFSVFGHHSAASYISLAGHFAKVHVAPHQRGAQSWPAASSDQGPWGLGLGLMGTTGWHVGTCRFCFWKYYHRITKNCSIVRCASERTSFPNRSIRLVMGWCDDGVFYVAPTCWIDTMAAREVTFPLATRRQTSTPASTCSFLASNLWWRKWLEDPSTEHNLFVDICFMSMTSFGVSQKL